mgnify:CR=1 FL=1
MSSAYTPTPGWSTINVLDDGDPADAGGIGAATFEALADRIAQLTNPKWVPCGAKSFKAAAGRFSLDIDYLGLVTATAAGDVCTIMLDDLVHGATIATIDVTFIPKTTARAGWPLGSAPVVSLTRWAIPSGGFSSNTLVDSVTYTPVSQADYQDGKFKVISMTSVGAVVDNVQYLYALTITDESGANAIPGALYAAYRVFYS